MALRDFKQYVRQVGQQYVEMKEDLADFEKAFRDGFITEDKLTEVKEDVTRIEVNYNRLLYVAFLLEQPNKADKKEKAKKAYSKLETAFDDRNATANNVVDENKSLLDDLRKQLKNLTKKVD